MPDTSALSKIPPINSYHGLNQLIINMDYIEIIGWLMMVAYLGGFYWLMVGNRKRVASQKEMKEKQEIKEKQENIDMKNKAKNKANQRMALMKFEDEQSGERLTFTEMTNRRLEEERQYMKFLNRNRKLIDRFLELTEIKVIKLDRYGEENWKALDKEVVFLIKKVEEKKDPLMTFEHIEQLKDELPRLFRKYHRKQKEYLASFLSEGTSQEKKLSKEKPITNKNMANRNNIIDREALAMFETL